MDDINVDANELLKKIAHSMRAKIVTWNNVKETIEKDISFAIIIDTNKYITKDELKKLEQKSFIGTINSDLDT